MLTKLFRCAKKGTMQWNKTSKKTRNIADETIASAPEMSAAAETTPKPRTTRSSKTKKTETTEAAPVNHHHKTSSGAAEKPKSAPITSSIVDPVGVVTPAIEAEPVTHEKVAQLAYSYWIARGYTSGGAEEDWLRAERELKGQR
jgi:Protein of unknown function (DUF2934)